MCTDISNTLEYTRPVETIFDIVFIINMFIRFITYAGKQDFVMTNDLKPTYKDIALNYIK